MQFRCRALPHTGVSTSNCEVDVLHFDLVRWVIAYNLQKPGCVQEFESLGYSDLHFVVPAIHISRFYFIRDMENIETFLQVKNLPHFF